MQVADSLAEYSAFYAICALSEDSWACLPQNLVIGLYL